MPIIKHRYIVMFLAFTVFVFGGFLECRTSEAESTEEQSLISVKKAAEQGHAWAQYDLGLMYAIGQGIPQDYKEAIRWFRKAAEQEDAKAQYNLGLMYSGGQGIPHYVHIDKSAHPGATTLYVQI